MSEPSPLRIGLERSAGETRYHTWLLDLPGAYGTAPSRELALSQAPSIGGWYRDWLERHGERLDITFGPTEVVAEIDREPETGAEPWGRFPADDEPVTPAEVGDALRRRGMAMSELGPLTARLGEVDPPDDERTGPAGILEHLARTEAWLVGRLDPTGAVDLLHDAPERDLAGAWTKRRVLRCILGHATHHLRELGILVARAERAVERLDVRDERLLDIGPLARLLRSVGWDRRVADLDRLEAAIAGSHRMVGAWDGDELVGFARDLGDGVWTGLISMVVVDPRWQRQGVAARLIGALVDDRPQVRFSLGAAAGLDGFYARLGFERDERAMVRRPRRG